MTALTRRTDAAISPVAQGRKSVHDLWHEAVDIRQMWIQLGLSTRPANREATERALTQIYARILRPQPRFEWVDSPHKALPLIADLPTHDLLQSWIRDPCPRGTPPASSDIAALASQLRSALREGIVRADPEWPRGGHGRRKQPWPELPPAEAIAEGIPLRVLVRQGVQAALHRTLAYGFYLPIRRALAAGRSLPVCWYGQQDASWVAYYDVLARLELAHYRPAEAHHLDEWATLVRSCGWWWPGEDVCVVVERPEVVRTEPLPGAIHHETRLRSDGVRYRDGWQPALT